MASPVTRKPAALAGHREVLQPALTRPQDDGLGLGGRTERGLGLLGARGVHEGAELGGELVETFAGLGRHGDDGARPRRASSDCQGLVATGRIEQVHLVERDDGGPVEQDGTEGGQLATHRVERRTGCCPAFGCVHHIDERRGALDVREEAVAEPRALAGALDQPGDVRQDDVALVAGRARRGSARAS